jgi:hypothetical protein
VIKGDTISMSQVTLRRTFSNISILAIAIIILAVATALIHLQLGVSMGSIAGHAGGAAGGHAGGPGGAGGARPGGAGGARPAGGGGSSIMSMLPVPLPVLFDLNFVGYIVLVVALYLPMLRRFQRIIRWLLIAFTAVTIIAWFAITGGHANAWAYADKPIELLLIVLLLIEEWQVVRQGKNAAVKG